MSDRDAQLNHEAWPRWWRLTLIAMATLILCSCSAPRPGQPAPIAPAGRPETLPSPAVPGPPGGGYGMPGGAPLHGAVARPFTAGPPLPVQVIAPWALPGIAQPWPHDEYLHDGGDRAPLVRVGEDWRVHGLELEDTVVHYDTLNGCTVVEPTNRVHIYAPRFAAVRKVEGVNESDQLDRVAGMALPIHVAGHNEALLATTAMQPLQPISEIGTRQASLFLDRQPTAGLVTQLQPIGVQDRLKPYEDMAIIRFGIFEQGDKARLAESAQAAIVWSHDTGLQVAIEKQQAQMEVSEQAVQATYTVDTPGCPRLQVCKVASTQHAKPGEMVDFTIRFDNVGDQKMGNVTIVDNLTTRLEYVPGSAQSSVAAAFSSQDNEGDSLVLRWEITDPIQPGEGGLVRFQCRVR